MTFDEWFLSINNPPYGAIYDLAKRAWDVAQEVEREACAKVCETPLVLGNGAKATAEFVAAAIRARGTNGQ